MPPPLVTIVSSTSNNIQHLLTITDHKRLITFQKCYLKLPEEIWSGLVQRYAAFFVHAVLCEYFRYYKYY